MADHARRRSRLRRRQQPDCWPWGGAGAPFGERAALTREATARDLVARGVSPSGLPYKVSAFEHEGWACVVIESDGASGGGCAPVERTRDVDLVPGLTLLGDDLYVWAQTRRDADGLVARRLDGMAEGTAAAPAALSRASLHHVVMKTPEETLPRTDFGLPVAPAIEVTATSGGQAVASETIRP